MVAVDFLVGSGNSDERDALRKMLVLDVTYIADRGYMSFSLANAIVKAESNFAFRVKSNLKLAVIETLQVYLPISVRQLFKNVSDQFICYENDPHNNQYRLISFTIINETYYILTTRLELTTFQIIMLYAYRWQIELLFRFLKRTINGIHLIKQDKNGVTIQFYALMITALLELNLKQKVMDIIEVNNPDSKEESHINDLENDAISDDIENEIIFDPVKEDGQSTSETTKKNTTGKVKDGGRISEAYQFFKIIGNKVKNIGKWVFTG